MNKIYKTGCIIFSEVDKEQKIVEKRIFFCGFCLFIYLYM